MIARCTLLFSPPALRSKLLVIFLTSQRYLHYSKRIILLLAALCLRRAGNIAYFTRGIEYAILNKHVPQFYNHLTILCYISKSRIFKNRFDDRFHDVTINVSNSILLSYYDTGRSMDIKY